MAGSAGAIVGVLYLLNLVTRWRGGRPLNFAKLLLALTTGGFYWYTGLLSTNLLIGLAMFEIYHAVQYYAIVWIYNRRLFERAGERFGWLGFLFRDRYTMLGIYLALIAAYSSIRYFTGDASSYIYTSDGNNAYQLLFALFVTSSLLHFYFDGFIWKVSDRRTQANLTDEDGTTSRLELSVPAVKHAAKWSIFVALAAGLLWSERKILRAETHQREQAVREGLMELTPELPEAKILNSRNALTNGQIELAAKLADEVVEMRPHSSELHVEAASVFLAAKRNDKVLELLEPLIARNSNQWKPAIDLAYAYERLGESHRAEETLLEAIRRQPNRLEPPQYLAEFYRRQNRLYDAFKQLQMVINENPRDYRNRLIVGDLLATLGKREQARVAYQETAKELRQAVAEAPSEVELQRLLGEALYQLGDWQNASKAFQACVRLQPHNEEHYVNLAFSYDALGTSEAAVATVRAGLEVIPDSEQLRLALEMLV
ncbi:MAG: tetratricopeptide repeat protein, partial [Lacipirellulaceae bacterium]